jgi:protein-disulfide isomerase
VNRLAVVASRKQQKEAARAAREQAVRQMKASQSRRTRMLTLYSVLAVAIVAVAAVILVSSSKGGGSIAGVLTQRDGAADTHAEAAADIKRLLNGIPQHGDVLGNPNAPVTVTEYGDLVCPVCDIFATSTEPQLISAEVRTGKVQLWFRGTETASNFDNNSEYTATQVAARAAGLQDKEWDYILLLYDEQPQTIGGKDAEDVGYVNSAYLLNRAQQIPGLNVAEWQRNLGDASLSQLVNADTASANELGVRGTPTLLFSGPKGTVQYDKDSTEPSVIPTLQQMQALIKQVS